LNVEGAVADRKELDRQVQREILDYLEERIGKAADPHWQGALAGASSDGGGMAGAMTGFLVGCERPS
jgi:hypothetical protein